MRDVLRGKEVHIIGMARSGLAAAEVLTMLGARVTAHDGKDSSQLVSALDEAKKLGVKARVGDRAYEGIADAELVVTSPGVPGTCRGLKDAVAAGVQVISEIELAYRIARAPIVAVTGTNGKTTTTALIGEIFRKSGRRVFVAGNIVAGDIRLPLVKAALEAEEADIIAAEISSFQLEWIDSFRPRAAALLNVTGDHLDRYPDMESYGRAKARLFEFQTAEDHAILNAEDPIVAGMAGGIKSRIWWFSSIREVEGGTFARGRQVWVSDAGGKRFVCDTSDMKLRGTHNLENVLAATAVALAFGIADEAIQAGVNSIEPPEHRMEPVAELGGVEFLNNSMCTNVAAVVRSLEAVGRPAVVIAGGKDKGSDFTPLGDAFNKYAKYLVLIGADAHLIEEAARSAGFDRISRAATIEEAVETAWKAAEPGDSVILCPGCASFDMFDDFEHRGRSFKAAVMDLVRRNG